MRTPGFAPPAKVGIGIGLVAAVAAMGIGAAVGSDTVKIAVEGRIAPKCTLLGYGAADTRAMTIIDLNSGRFQYGYNIECNAPFQYSVESQKGALAHEGHTIITKRLEARLPYALAVNIPTDDVIIDDRCPSETIQAGRITCPFHNSGQGIALNSRATLTLSWNQPVAALPAGTYSDRLTFAVGVRL